MSSSPELPPITLRLAVCLFPGVCALDYQGPIELLGFLSPESPNRLPSSPKFLLEITYLAPEKDVQAGGVTPARGPKVFADATYEEIIAKGEQFDIVLIPGGPGARPSVVPLTILSFIQNQLPGICAKPHGYILSVCTGSWILATAGVLDGKRATTNKAAFKECRALTGNNIDWIAKARWVEEDDKRLWSSSGVTAGMTQFHFLLDDTSSIILFHKRFQMFLNQAWIWQPHSLVHLIGNELTTFVRGIVELGVRTQDDDEFAGYYGLASSSQSL